VQSAADLDRTWFDGVQTLGVSAGASAPEELVEDVLTQLAGFRKLSIEEVRVASEDVVFKLPREVA
jgi:4-hydroxy-3-methylbut-2-en-1-yl diphosphate reductase